MSLVLLVFRAGFVAGLLLSSGLSLFALLVLPRAVVGQAACDAVWRPGRGGAVAALVLGGLCWAGWVLAQSAAIAGAGSAGALATALPVVLGDTRFGRLALAQGVLLAVCALAVGGAPRAGLVRIVLPALLALLLQAGHGHGWAMRERDWPLLLAGLLHLVCAGFWLGGLAGLLLLLLLRTAPVRLVASAARWFGPPGRLCVAGMALSAWVQGMVLVGSVHGLFGTAYGRVALLKLGLFGGLTGFALLNRHRLAPALLGAAPERARRRLALSIGVQGLVGLLAVLAASLLSGLPPAMHAMDRAGMGM